MNRDFASRLIAAAVLSVPLSVHFTARARAELLRLNKDPSGYLEHARHLIKTSFPMQLLGWAILTIAFMILIEGLAYLVRIAARGRGPNRAA